MVQFFNDYNLNNWWKRKIAKLYPRQKFGFKVGNCAICGTEDYVFPSGELKIGDRCYQKMLDNGAEIVSHRIGLSLKPYRCDVCGRKIYKYHVVQTYICNKCTIRIGQMAKENRLYYGARKIA